VRGVVVGFDEDGVHLHVAFGDFEAGGQAVEKFFDDALAVHADDAAVRAGHTDVGDVGGALGKDALVGGGDVSVRADYRGGAAIEIPAHGNFFAGGFGVYVNEDESDVGRERGEFGVGFAKRIVDGGEKGAALQIEDGILHAISGGAGEEAAAGRAIGKIRGAQEARFMGQIVEDFAAVPTVIAAGEDVDAVVEEFVGEARGDAETGGGIFAVGDDQIDFLLSDDVGEALADDVASRGANDVTDEENTHAGSLPLKEGGGKESLGERFDYVYGASQEA